MKKSCKNGLILILTSLLIINGALFTGCAGDTDKGGDAQSTGLTETQAESETEFVYTDAVPDSELDFSGREFRILSSLDPAGHIDGYHCEVTVESENGEIFNDAVYSRNRKIEERFGITFKEEYMDYFAAESAAKSLITSDDDAYELISLVDRFVFSFALNGMIIPTEQLRYVDLEQPYWGKTLNSTLSVNGKQLVALNDFSLTGYDLTHLLLFNRNMLESLSLEDPYDLVENQQWTFDKVSEMCMAATQDLNGNGAMDEEDMYGWSSAMYQVPQIIWVAGGALSVSKDSDDTPCFSMNDERMIDLLQVAYDLTWGSDAWFKNQGMEIDWKNPFLFGQEQALFASTVFHRLFDSAYRDITAFTYNIIPHPKYNEEQENYYSRVSGSVPYFVPATATDTDFIGAITEALACASRNTVIPAYYDICLKTKLALDERSADMLDIISNNRIYDMGDTIFYDIIRTPINNKFASKKVFGASDIEKIAAKVETAIEKAVDAVAENYG